MLKRRIDPRGTEIEIFVPEDQAERDLLAGIVNHHIPERYNVLAAEPEAFSHQQQTKHLPEYIAFGLILSRASQTSIYRADEYDGLMGVYFRAYVTTDPEERIQIDLVIEDNNEAHLEAICEIVNKKKPSVAAIDIGPPDMPHMPADHSWTVEEALKQPGIFMWSVNGALNQDPKKRTEWVQI